MANKNINIISTNVSIRVAIKNLDIKDINSIFVVNKHNKLIGVFTEGDFRRAVLGGLDLNKKVLTLVNKNFIYLFEGCSRNEIKKIFINNPLILDLPILNKKFEIVKIVNQTNFLTSSELRKLNFKFKNINVVVMAGGKGTRLSPFTNVLPKPLMPIKENPIIKLILDKFIEFQINNFYISIFEKGEMIKAYLNNYIKTYNIKYIEEKKPLGTIGALSLIKSKLKKTFFLTNCDILVDCHYPSILKFHSDNNYDLTIVASQQVFSVPYGICNTDSSGKLLSMKEKPSYTYLVNTGFYVVEPKVLKFVPENQFFNMDDLIKKINQNNMKIGVFPLPEKSWKDIGNLNNFLSDDNQKLL